MGESFTMLLIARAIEGVGSACINVCGMSLIAHVSARNRFFEVFLLNDNLCSCTPRIIKGRR